MKLETNLIDYFVGSADTYTLGLLIKAYHRELSELNIERISDGITVALPTNDNDAELKDLLIFQLEEPYAKIDVCAESDEHLYNVSLYIGEKLDASVILSSNGYICKNGKRYVCSDKAERTVDINQWSALFDEWDE